MITCTHWLGMFWYLVEFCPSVKLLICLMAKKMDPEDGLEKKSQTTSMRLSRNTNTKKGWALQTNVINQKWEIEKLPFVFINVCCFISKCQQGTNSLNNETYLPLAEPSSAQLYHELAYQAAS